MPRTTKKAVALKERSIDEVDIRIIGTAPILAAHNLQWDMLSYWDDQPAEVSRAKVKIKRPMAGQLKLLEAIRRNGYDLDYLAYDNKRGVNALQDAVLRGHWLPDLAPGFPVNGFLGAMQYGAVQYGGKNYGMPATKVRALIGVGDKLNTILVRILTAAVSFDNQIGTPPHQTAPRHIVRIQYELPWETTLRIRYSSALFTPEQIAQLAAWAGDFGVGQWRPSSPHGGQHGTFRVATPDDPPFGRTSKKKKSTPRRRTAKKS